MGDIAHPLVDEVGEGGGRCWSLTETRAAVVRLDPWRLDLLRRAAEAGDRELVLASDELSCLTPAFAQVWRDAGAHWLVRDPAGGLRDGFSGRPLRGIEDLWASTPVDDVAVRHLEPIPVDAVEVSAVVCTRLPARGATRLGGAVAALASVVGTTPTAWGRSEPVLDAWDAASLTARVRDTMPAPSQLLVRGPRLAAVVRGRRTRHGLEETTHATLAVVADEPGAQDVVRRTPDTLARLAETTMPLVGLLLAQPGRRDLLRGPFLRPPAVPLALLVGAPAVQTLHLDPAAERHRTGAEAVGRPRLPALLYRLADEPTDPGAAWRRLEQVLDGFDPALRAAALGQALGPLQVARPACWREGGTGAQP